MKPTSLCDKNLLVQQEQNDGWYPSVCLVIKIPTKINKTLSYYTLVTTTYEKYIHIYNIFTYQHLVHHTKSTYSSDWSAKLYTLLFVFELYIWNLIYSSFCGLKYDSSHLPTKITTNSSWKSKPAQSCQRRSFFGVGFCPRLWLFVYIALNMSYLQTIDSTKQTPHLF